MVAFGRECLAGGRWSARLPLVLVDAHSQLANASGDADAYGQQPAVWPDLRAVYDGYLAVYPKATGMRSVYAKWAVHCHQWATADAQLKILGADVDEDDFADNGTPGWPTVKQARRLIARGLRER